MWEVNGTLVKSLIIGTSLKFDQVGKKTKQNKKNPRGAVVPKRITSFSILHGEYLGKLFWLKKKCFQLWVSLFSFRYLVMNVEFLRFSSWTRCLCIQQKKLYGMKILFQLSIIPGKVWQRNIGFRHTSWNLI